MSTNRLGGETSLYLRQHAGNPVYWQPWGPEAIARARTENKPIFLSIGYSACHWCHVMEHESFLDEAIAGKLNDHFISIKVDREERPDLDNIYMSAVVALTGHGGWPMSVFLTPQLQPFYAGTYFPPRDRGGMPGFDRILDAIHQAWVHKREELIEQAGQITQALQEQLDLASENAGPLQESLLARAGQSLARVYDPRYGGFGSAPKFPHPFDLRLLLRLSLRSSDASEREMVTNTLSHMAQGGIYDQLAGGFHRYSTDARWLVPHFEKMLYDNALLAPVYVETYQITGDPFYRRIAEETFDWVRHEMTSPSGAFYSTTDADSEGEEGKYFVWTEKEVQDILGADADFALEVFEITQHGNWEGHNILTRPKNDSQEARLRQIAPEAFLRQLNEVRARLLAARERRVKPARDEKILTAWNALMISALAQAGSALSQPEYVRRAETAAAFVASRLRQSDGRLFRTTLESGPAKLNAYLEDYAFLVDALTHLYEATFQDRWLLLAIEIADVMIEQFWDKTNGGFYYVGHDHEPLILREKQPQDNAVPSGNSMAATGLLHLHRLTGKSNYWDKAEQTLKLFAVNLAQQPMAFGQMLIALDDYLGPVEELVVFGNEGELREARQLLAARYQPRKLLAGGASDPSLVPLVAHRAAVNGQVTIYRCVNQTCDKPWVGMEEIRNQWAENKMEAPQVP